MATEKKPVTTGKGDEGSGPAVASSVPKKSAPRKTAANKTGATKTGATKATTNKAGAKRTTAKKTTASTKSAAARGQTSKSVSAATQATETEKAVDLREPPERPLTSSGKVAEPSKAAGATTAAPVTGSATSDKPAGASDKKVDTASATPNADTPPPAAKAKEPATEPPQERSIFWPLLIGGALAAAMGFAVAELDMLGTRGGDQDALRAQLDDQQAQIAALKEATPEPQAVEFPALDDLSEQVTTLTAQLSGIEERLTTVEKQPMTGGSSDAAVAAYERELAALQASVAEQSSEIEGLLDNALSVEDATADAARRATVQAAMTRITTSLSAGRPFAAPLADLQAEGIDDIPAALSDVSETGVTTLINLQTRFPDAARAALSEARSAAGPEAEGGFTGFLRRQLGARSVAPREGTDPDAILSRAEAAVRDGRLTDALAEVDTLPEAAQAAMAEWLTDARARQAAEDAADDLSQRLTAS